MGLHIGSLGRSPEIVIDRSVADLDDQVSSGEMHGCCRIHSPAVVEGRDRGGGAGAAGPGFPGAALPDAKVELVLASR